MCDSIWIVNAYDNKYNFLNSLFDSVQQNQLHTMQ